MPEGRPVVKPAGGHRYTVTYRSERAGGEGPSRYSPGLGLTPNRLLNAPFDFWHPTGNFEGRPLVVVFFLLDMDFLLYAVSVQRGDAHISGLRLRSTTSLKPSDPAREHTDSLPRPEHGQRNSAPAARRQRTVVSSLWSSVRDDRPRARGPAVQIGTAIAAGLTVRSVEVADAAEPVPRGEAGAGHDLQRLGEEDGALVRHEMP